MAFTDTTVRLEVEGTNTGSEISLTTFAIMADILVSGSFTGSVFLQAQTVAEDWVTVCTLTAEGAMTVSYARARPLRVTSNLSSGSATYSLETAVEYREER